MIEKLQSIADSFPPEQREEALNLFEDLKEKLDGEYFGKLDLWVLVIFLLQDSPKKSLKEICELEKIPPVSYNYMQWLLDTYSLKSHQVNTSFAVNDVSEEKYHEEKIPCNDLVLTSEDYPPLTRPIAFNVIMEKETNLETNKTITTYVAENKDIEILAAESSMKNLKAATLIFLNTHVEEYIIQDPPVPAVNTKSLDLLQTYIDPSKWSPQEFDYDDDEEE